MTKVICIVGLPGSGKTHLANEMCLSNDTLIIDDIKNINQLPENELYETIIITDPYFCVSKVRDSANKIFKEKYNTIAEWIFFENNMEKCINNVIYRNDGRKVNASIKIFHKLYVIPDNVIIHEIYEIKQ